MTRLEFIIGQVKKFRTGENRPWIYFPNGEIKYDVFIGDILPLLEKLKEYEVKGMEIKEDFFDDYDVADNTYNWNANISNDIDYRIKDGFCLIKVHLCGDIRCGYSDYFVIDLQGYDSLIEFCYYELEEAVMQYVAFGEDSRYVADIDIFAEGFNVWDSKEDKDLGMFYNVEAKDVLEEIKEMEEE